MKKTRLHLLFKFTSKFKVLIALIGISLLFGFKSCSSSQQIKPDQNMTYSDYEDLWKAYSKLKDEGKFQDAKVFLETIEARAVEDKNDEQRLKTWFVRYENLSVLDESPIQNQISYVENYMKELNPVAQSISKSYLAELYYQYFQQNRYKLRNLTDVGGEPAENIEQWTIRQLLEKVESLYIGSLSNRAELDVPLNTYNALIDDLDASGAPLRKTIYDLLAHRAIDHFNSIYANITEPIDAFVFDQEGAFAQSQTFTNLKIVSPDEHNKVFRVLQIFQELEAFHRSSSSSILDDIVLKRLQFVYKNGIHDNKSELYTNALSDIFKKSDEDASFDAARLLIEHYMNQTEQSYWNRGEISDPSDRAYRQAVEIIEEALTKFEDKKHTSVLNALKSNITRPSSNFNTEQVFPTNEHFPVLIRFRNLEQADILIYKLTENQLLEHFQDKKIEALTQSKNLLRKTTYQFPVTTDYNWHTIECLEKPLESGFYIIELNDNKGNISSQILNISNISYSLNDNNFVQVSHRKTGIPLQASITNYSYQWEGRSRKLNKVGTGRTTTLGLYNPEKTDNRSSIYRFENEGDVLFLNEYVSFYFGSNNPQTEKLYAFTDRSIYRPGQDVFYKVIFTDNQLGKEPTVLKNESIQITLRDANYQEVSSSKTITNEFGSVHGKFSLPQNLLNGNFTIEYTARNSVRQQTSISVEEYKRPKFQVENEPMTAKYKLNETVAISGIAKTFAGSPVDGATVNYKVTRTQPYRYYYRYFNPQPAKIIATGFTKTKDDGRYELSFIAEPDRSNKQENAVFTYEIQVEVTDISGETRTTRSYVSAGNRYYLLNLPAKQRYYPSTEKKFPLSISNQSGDPANEKIKISIESLESPTRTHIETYWNTPDFYQLTKDEYNKLAPTYAYGEEANKEKWKTLRNIKTEEIALQGSLEYELPELSAGHYRITVEHPEAMTATSFIEVIEPSRIPASIPLGLSSDKKMYRSGENATVSIYSSSPETTVYIDIMRITGVEKRQIRSVIGRYDLTIPVEKADRGGILVYVSTVKNNRHTTEFVKINVPYVEKKLAFSWESFRSDLLPGSEEKWRLTISDNNDQPVIAEVLSSMYDASLDQFRPHGWSPFFLNEINNWFSISPQGFEQTRGITTKAIEAAYYDLPQTSYPFMNTRLNSLHTMDHYAGARSKVMRSSSAPPAAEMAMEAEEADAVMVVAKDGDMSNSTQVQSPEAQPAEPEVPVRKNLDETVFFFPELKTNKDGETILEFTMNEALTTWNFQTFAHTPDMKFHLDSRSVITSKDLMVFPSGPRFFREGDKITLPAKIQNMSSEPLLAEASLQIIDARSGRDITTLFNSSETKQSVRIEKERSATVSWDLIIPSDIDAIRYVVSAKAGTHTDGEENTALILPNRKLVTESLALTLPANSTKGVIIPSFETIQGSSTAEPQLFQVAVTSNPSWLAVQSLPYLMEYPYKCTEQVFSRYFANRLGAYILRQNPGIEEVYQSWKDKDQLISALTKNQELKSALLQQTPWVMDALSEEEQMQRLAFLFDMKKIEAESSDDLATIQQRQNGGGFPWFPGGRPNWYITQYILEGFGQLDKMGVIDRKDNQYRSIIMQGLQFLEKEVAEHDKRWKNDEYIAPIIIHYLYVRSFFPEHKPSQNAKNLIDKYVRKSQDLWLKQGILNQGHLALYFHRSDNREWADKITESLRQRTIFKEDLGRYWKEVNGYFWHESAIENQALLIAAFDEITANSRRDNTEIDEMKQWLLSNKRTNSWKSTKATTQAVYALVERGEKWISNDQLVTFKVGGESQAIPQDKLVAATGQYDITYRSEAIKAEFSSVEFNNPNDHMAWGSTTVQYWENLDKVKSYQETPLKLRRTYYIKRVTDRGDQLIELEGGENLRVGDVLTVRIQLIVDRPMEFIHLQDLRASGTEPVDVISRYKWQGGLGYYMETRDAATNFFVDYLPRGEYTLEYDQRASQAGEFSAGLATIQSMYAPEFGAQSDGTKLTIGR